jgi:hypothetical protein
MSSINGRRVVASQRSISDWKVWLLIWGLGVLGTLALIPYLVELLGGPMGEQARKAGVGLATFVAAQVAQGIVLLGVSSRIGIWAARRSGLTFPIFDAIVARGPIPWPGRAALLTIATGLAGGALVVGLDVFAFAPAKQISLSGAQPGAWEGFLASFYGGISEEIFLRLFLLSLLVLGLRRLILGPGAVERPLPWAAFWTANLLAAVVFGLGHLPATAALVPLTPLLVVQAIVLNGILALLFGELYRRWGLEMAILAHFSADIALHVVPPLVA